MCLIFFSNRLASDPWTALCEWWLWWLHNVLADQVVYRKQSPAEQEKLTNCVSQAADVLYNFLAGKHNANPLITWHLHLLRLCNAYQFKVLLYLLPFDRSLKGSSEIPNLGGLWSVRRRDVYQSNAYPRFPNTARYKRLHYLAPFGRNLKGEFWEPQFWWLWEYGVRSRANWKPTHDLQVALNTKSCSVCCCATFCLPTLGR